MAIPAYPLAAATSAKSVLLGSRTRRPTPIHPDPYSNPMHGYAAAVASAAAGAGSQVINTVHCLSLSAPHEFPYIGHPDFDCRRMCAVPPSAGLPGQRSGVSSQLGRHGFGNCCFGDCPSTLMPTAPLPRACLTAANIWLRAREQRVIRCLLGGYAPTRRPQCTAGAKTNR